MMLVAFSKALCRCAKFGVLVLWAVLGAYFWGRLKGKDAHRRAMENKDYEHAEKIRDDVLRALNDGERMRKHDASGFRD